MIYHASILLNHGLHGYEGKGSNSQQARQSFVMLKPSYLLTFALSHFRTFALLTFSAIRTPLSVLSRPTAPTFPLFPNFLNHQSARIKTNKNARIEVGFHSLRATRYSLPLRTVLTTSSRRSRAGFQNCNHWLQKAGHRPHHLRTLPLASGIASREAFFFLVSHK